MSLPVQIDRIGQIHISVEDLDRSVHFYRDILGMRLLFEVPEQSMAFLDCGGVRLYLGKPEAPEFRSSPLIYYAVGDLTAACEAIESSGLSIAEPPHVVHRDERHELWMAGLLDPDGHHVCLMSEHPRSGV